MFPSTSAAKAQPGWVSGQPLRLERVAVVRGRTEILRGIDLEFHADKNYVLIGASGAGKSTLLRLLNRLEEPSSGRLFTGDRPLAAIPVRAVRERVGLVFQSPRLLPGTVEENLSYSCRIRRTPEPNPLEWKNALQDLGLDPAGLGRDASSLSGGERQRLALAMALQLGPEILALDEPTSALDPAAVKRVLDVLARRDDFAPLRTISVCHHRGHAALLADHAIVMHAGLVVDQGPTGDVLSRIDDSVWESSP